MVLRMERELDNKFEGFEERKDPCLATPAAEEAPEQGPHEVAAELEILKTDNEQFNNSFVEVVVESATKERAVEAASDAPKARVSVTLPQEMQRQPPAINNRWKMEEAEVQQSPGGSVQQKAPGDEM